LWIEDSLKNVVYLLQWIGRRGGTRMRRIHQDDEPHVGFMLDLDGIAREGARRMLAEALEAEVEAYVQAARDERDERGHALVVRTGYANEREILLGAGSV